ncbi:hypothetical protein [Azospirillum palustre]
MYRALDGSSLRRTLFRKTFFILRHFFVGIFRDSRGTHSRLWPNSKDRHFADQTAIRANSRLSQPWKSRSNGPNVTSGERFPLIGQTGSNGVIHVF